MTQQKKKQKRIISFVLIVIAFAMLIGLLIYWMVSRVGELGDISVGQTEEELENNQVTLPETPVEELDFDFDALQIGEYEYPAEFELTDTMKEAIALLAGSYDNYSAEMVYEDYWQEYFISHYLTNSHYTFTYLMFAAEMSDDKLTKEQVEYMNYALTGQKIDFDLDEPVDVSDASYFDGEQYLGKYTYEVSGDTVTVKADLYTSHTTFDGEDVVVADDIIPIKVKLKKNPYSCFDGYSIISIKREELLEESKAELSGEGPITNEEFLSFKQTCEGPKDTTKFMNFADLMKRDYYGTWYSPEEKCAMRLTPDGAYLYYPLLDFYGDTLYCWDITDRSDSGLCPMLVIHEHGPEYPGITYYVAGATDDYFYGNSQGYVFYRQ
jgi:hypothetical protein